MPLTIAKHESLSSDLQQLSQDEISASFLGHLDPGHTTALLCNSPAPWSKVLQLPSTLYKIPCNKVLQLALHSCNSLKPHRKALQLTSGDENLVLVAQCWCVLRLKLIITKTKDLSVY